jgi:hypothetical protein
MIRTQIFWQQLTQSFGSNLELLRCRILKPRGLLQDIQLGMVPEDGQ